ncbi:MAG: RNA-binding protein [Halanaerobiales bacterium]
MLDREKMLSHLYREEDQILGGHILDKIEIVNERGKEQATDFLNPYQRKIARKLIEQVYEVNFLEAGGYDRAERKRVVFFPEYLFPDHIDVPVDILKVKGNFDFSSVSHGDFLGALMGLGIKRKMVGDILVLSDFAQVIVASEISEFISLKLNQVHEVPVEIEQINGNEVVVPTPNSREIPTTVASMRLDAVASAGFGASRGKISREIKNNKAKLNWKPETDPAQDVEVDDLISIKNRGRVKIVKDRGLSNRGRIKLLLKRFT